MDPRVCGGDGQGDIWGTTAKPVTRCSHTEMIGPPPVVIPANAGIQGLKVLTGHMGYTPNRAYR